MKTFSSVSKENLFEAIVDHLNEGYALKRIEHNKDSALWRSYFQKKKKKERMKIPTAAQRRKCGNKEVKQTKANIAGLARRFVREEIAKAIQEAEGSSINEALPYGAYDFKAPSCDCYKIFIDTCRSILEPLGYHVELSHDGGGMYSTLYVSWRRDENRNTA